MAAGKQKISVAPRPPSPAAFTPEANDKKNKRKKRATTPKTRPDDTDTLSPSDTLDFGTLPAPDEGLAEAIATVLEAPRAAVNGGTKSNNIGAAGADATAAAQAELLATANELYQRMDAGGGGLRPDGAYWAALPAHIRNFVRTASLSPPLHIAGGNERAKAQAMYTIAQQMVQTGEQGEGQDQVQATTRNDVDGASERDMATATAAGRIVAGWQGEMTLPVDPTFFADAAFTAALEEQGEKGGVIEVGVGVAEVTSGEGGEEEDRSYSEEVEGDRWPVAGERGRNRGRNRWGSVKMTASVVAGVAADEEGRDREEDEEIPTSDGKLLTSSAVSDLLPKAEAAVTATVAAAAAPRAAAPKSKSSMPSQTKQPSSRAQGKQPMNYAPPPTTTTTTATTTTTTATTATTTTTTTAQQKTNTPSPTTRSSSKAASKAPLHPYPHTHPHHHPSPPSSNGSQPQKHRPPSTQVPSARNHPSINNKIWSTSSTEERERIKEFWLGLGEEERRNLVKVEKEAVLKKMKEQQRHSCACAVCGRKRSVHRLCLLTFSLPSLMTMRPFLHAIIH